MEERGFARSAAASALSVVAALALIAALNAGVSRVSPEAALPAVAELRSAPEDLVRDASMLVMGMRRLAADLTFVQLILYYGSPDSRGEEDPAEHGRPGHAHRDFAAGAYAELLARVRRVLALDPRFEYAAFHVAGALAFNQNRPDEALVLLEEARGRRPENWRYAAYIAAIGFHKKGDAESVLKALAQSLAEPDCPTMVRHMAAYLNEKAGHRVEAASLYRELLASRDENYHEIARRGLRRLGAL
ncbi:MAG: hypothetical protein WC969_03385 [Elusimicrobiota bacterium]|jgi:tetratricopeptide (TPR) repeat protein